MTTDLGFTILTVSCSVFLSVDSSPTTGVPWGGRLVRDIRESGSPEQCADPSTIKSDESKNSSELDEGLCLFNWSFDVHLISAVICDDLLNSGWLFPQGLSPIAQLQGEPLDVVQEGNDSLPSLQSFAKHS